MSFQPAVPLTGLPGWAFLQNTMDRQTESFDRSPRIYRDTEYFEARIGEIATAEELVADRRLLRVALGAFGLQDDLDSRFLIRRVLEGGTADPDALANRLSDGRYREMADAFGFAGPAAPGTRAEGFGAGITALYRQRAFEVAVGDKDQSLRLALNADRELAAIARESGADETKWLRIMGTPPLREVFETVLGLPQGFAQLDLDRQIDVFRDRTREQLDIASLSELAAEDSRARVIERYLLRDQIGAINVYSSQSIALSLLQKVPPIT